MALRACIALLLGLLALPIQPARAQSFFPAPYGYGSAPPRPYRYPGMSPYRAAPSFSPNPSYDDEERLPERIMTYRTLCVRLCDGYYYPISSAVTQHGFARDADTCSASCGGEARLFYHPNVGGDVETMVDLMGIAYSALPNAFKYRKTLVDSCRCRPQPWSEAEIQRHRSYALGQSVAAHAPGGSRPAAGQDGRPASDAPTIPPAALRAPSPDDPGVVARPSPVARQAPVQAGWPYANSDARGTPWSRYEWPGDHTRP